MPDVFDARLTWIQHLAPHGEIAIVIQGNNTDPPLQTMVGQFTTNACAIEIIDRRGKHDGTFTPLDPAELAQLRSRLILYLVSTREPSCVLRRRLSTLGQEVTGEYSILPNWSNPRWFIPQARSLFVGKMSGMIKPTRPLARAAVLAFRILRSIGLHSLVFPCRIFLVHRDHDIDHENEAQGCFDQLRKRLHLAPGIVYTGSYGPLQKFTVELLDESGATVAYSKFGHDRLTNEAIQREHDALNHLNKLSIPKIQVPKIIDYKVLPERGDTILTQTTLDGGSPLKSMSDELVNALISLFLATRQTLEVSVTDYTHPLYSDIKSFINEGCESGIAGDCKLILHTLDVMMARNGENKIPLAISHGDFTRWNVTLKDSCLQVFDWEEAKMRPPGHDLLNFFFTENLLINKLAEEKVAAISLKLYLQQDYKYIVRYFEQLSPSKINAETYHILFWAEVARLNMWHIIRHRSGNYPNKDYLYKVIRTAALSCEKFTEFSCAFD